MDFLLQHWAEIVATVALIQPWIYWLWRKYLRRGAIEIYESYSPQLGFSFYGPIVTLYGTLRASSREQFISHIGLNVIREKDSARHTFEWGLFRAPKIAINEPDKFEVEIPSSFLVSPLNPHRYGITFFDNPSKEEINAILIQARRDWEAYCTSEAGKLVKSAETDASAKNLLEALRSDLTKAQDIYYSQFSKTAEFTAAVDKIKRIYYWEPGKYKIDLTVFTDHPARQFNKTWRIELSDEEASNLRSNIDQMLQQATKKREASYHFTQPKYQKAA
jgi:hypothetical protein